MRIHVAGQDINTVEQWYEHAKPKRGELHWKDGRSAKELARAWCGTEVGVCIPVGIADLLLSHKDTCDLILTEGTPESRIRFDEFRGQPRNADLAMVAND